MGKSKDIANYLSLFVNHNDMVMLIDTENKEVFWLSEKASIRYPDVKIGQKCQATLHDMGIDCNTTKKLNELLEIQNTNNLDLKIIKDNEYDLEISCIDDSVAVLRIQAKIYSKLAHSRHLEDREKLLFTSRSITVSEMASTLAHEINQPIGTINNLLYGLRARLLRLTNIDEDLYKAIDKSIEQTRYTSDIISRIRDYTHSRKPKIGNVEVTKLINKCVSLMDWEMRNTNVTIQYHHSPNVATIRGDEIMLQQVIVNLIRNGMDANHDSDKDNNKIKIVTSTDDQYVNISIEDNGKGLTDKEAESLFIPFASNKSTGMGIGLNICRSFIELHKGKLWLTKNENRGCTSHIMLPVTHIG
jgi:signal transduction histidine kinase